MPLALVNTTSCSPAAEDSVRAEQSRKKLSRKGDPQNSQSDRTSCGIEGDCRRNVEAFALGTYDLGADAVSITATLQQTSAYDQKVKAVGKAALGALI